MTESHLANPATEVIVAGALAIDLSCNHKSLSKSGTQDTPQLHTSNPASIKQSLGGVGQNIATALHYLKSKVLFCSSVGEDIAGLAAIDMLAKRGLSTHGIKKLSSGSRTAQYIAINDAKRNLVLAMADMDILHDTLEDFDGLWQPQIDSCKPTWLVVDANWDPVTLRKWLRAAKNAGSLTAYEPVSVAKSQRIFLQLTRDHDPVKAFPNNLVNLAKPNALELASMYEAANSAGLFEREDWWDVINNIGISSLGAREKLVYSISSLLVDQGVPQQILRLLPFIPCLLTTLGDQGVLLTQLLRPDDDHLTSPESAPYILSRSTDGNGPVGGVYMRLFPPPEIIYPAEIVSVNGVGDTFLGVLIAGLAKQKPKDITQLIEVAQKGSVMTLKSQESVSEQIATLKSAI